MHNEKINITDDGRVYFETYIHDYSHELKNNIKPAVIVCPGGGYDITSDREAEPVALQYFADDFNVFVLRYSVANYSAYPSPLVDLCKTIKEIRLHAKQWNIDKDKIAVCGFSAGGHLVGSLGTLWNDKEIMAVSGCLNEENKPNALILIYPVLDAYKYAHKGSIRNCMQNDLENESLHHKLNCIENVGLHTPPTFLAHAFNDDCVPVENSLLFGQALANQNIPFEMHIFEGGHHGTSLSNHITYSGLSTLLPDFSKWMELSENWLWNMFGREIDTVKYDFGTAEGRAKI